MRLLLFFLVLAACAPNPQAPVRVVALISKAPGSYEPGEVELKTIKDVVALKGDVATFIGGARIILDPADPQGLNDEQYARLITKGAGGDVHVNYIEKDGVLWPADFDSWNLVTSYYNFEKAYEYFQTTGIASDELKGATVYYFPELVNRGISVEAQRDNALFLQPLKAFLILPFEKLQKVPLPINAGVVAHEYAHRVWNARVYGGRGQPEAFTRWSAPGAQIGLNLLKALDEGLADYHAYGTSCLSVATCDPRFLAPSLPEEFALPRDLSLPSRCMSTGQRTSLESMGVGDFLAAGLDYRIGTALASGLYQAGEKSGKRQDLQRAIIAAYSDENAARPGLKQLITANLDTPVKFKLELVVDSMLAHIEDLELRKRTCNELWARLKLDISAVPNCPTLSAPVQDCVGTP